MTQPSSSVLFREIHKNAWLKRLPVGEKKALPSNKKAVKVWVVFCVHDDVDPFLEFYLDQEQSAAHKPVSSVPLNQALHVSPTICAHEDEFEFVVTLQSDIVRLTASSWDQMMEWVEAITGKLREMRILSPKENLYSRMPEQRAPLLPTRDPNSPLPLPPLGPSSLLPGVEPVAHPASESQSDRTHHSVLSPTQVGMIAPSTDSSEYQSSSVQQCTCAQVIPLSSSLI
uniref:PH domain-containing protein n=1 Tax=Cacopsylla melanoneura TaxID=428564 RepID=A0A8D8XQW0_9HEMI